MQDDKKVILLISYDNWGYNQYIADALERKSHKVVHINFYKFKYEYPNKAHQVFNFFTKNLQILNLKHQHYDAIISEKIKDLEKIDVAIYIKADFLAESTIQDINKKSKKSVLIISDSINRYPKTKKILHLFDRVFSFEKKDCEKYNLIFKPNFIYKKVVKSTSPFLYKVFNISSYDHRFPIIKKIGEALYSMNEKSKIIIFSSKENKEPYLEFTKKALPISEIYNYLEQSEIMLDVNRDKQNGLSFRVFESLGFKKKLITTNKDIVNYDFYNPNNIFVIDDVENIKIPKSFFNYPYEEVPDNILQKYYIDNWVCELVE